MCDHCSCSWVNSPLRSSPKSPPSVKRSPIRVLPHIIWYQEQGWFTTWSLYLPLSSLVLCWFYPNFKNPLQLWKDPSLGVCPTSLGIKSKVYSQFGASIFHFLALFCVDFALISKIPTKNSPNFFLQFVRSCEILLVWFTDLRFGSEISTIRIFSTDQNFEKLRKSTDPSRCSSGGDPRAHGPSWPRAHGAPCTRALDPVHTGPSGNWQQQQFWPIFPFPLVWSLRFWIAVLSPKVFRLLRDGGSSTPPFIIATASSSTTSSFIPTVSKDGNIDDTLSTLPLLDSPEPFAYLTHRD